MITLEDLQAKFDFGLPWCTANEGMACVLRPENVIVHEGKVQLRAIHHPLGICGVQYMDDGSVRTMAKYFSSGIIMSKQKYLYGEFHAKIHIPDYRGAWPSVWLYGESPDQGYDELDLFEQFRKSRFFNKTDQQTSVIWKENGTKFHDARKSAISHKWLDIFCSWDRSNLMITVDDQVVYDTDIRRYIPQQPMHFIISHYIGNWKPRITYSDTLFIAKLVINGEEII